ncbi:MAG: T9SS type A sorting domain-containing protein, partial [Bacteroidota bacterium]
LQNLQPGEYRVTVTDANTCAYFSIFYQIGAPKSPVTLLDFQVTDATCFGESDGSIDIHIVGGTQPYFYNWDLPAVTEDLENVPAGEYHLTVLDENFCGIDSTFEVGQPDSLEILTSQMPAALGQSNGWAAVSVSGGTPPYLFLWENGETNDTLQNVQTGWYEVVVTDANFCQKTAWVKVELETGTVENEAVARFWLFPNPAQDIVKLSIETGQVFDLEVRIYDGVGQEVYSVFEGKGVAGVVEMNLEGFAAGVYWVIVRADGEGVFEDVLIIGR